eukprot:CAMPEP_0168755386 /NCGR_PEP_ID=MMETSP0724-20121128/20040_1 /TAXON_ID=265536 /ORGANISM="Amphiprora sp., Strain CCMP467" /LENGTH=180 /DNA_ID=CAMNT_0008803995 /DNA_START=93 /DNA_END=636 /DNA_ORIENTATION=-
MASWAESDNKWLISSSSTTSILTSSTTMESQDQRSTHLSQGISTNEDSSATSNRAGAPTTSSLGPSSSTSLLQRSQMPWKSVSELEYFDTSTTNKASISLPSAEAEKNLEAECCECSSRAGLYMHETAFPDNAINKKLFPHAKEGWELLRASNRLIVAYPQELADLSERAMVQGKGLTGF